MYFIFKLCGWIPFKYKRRFYFLKQCCFVKFFSSFAAFVLTSVIVISLSPLNVVASLFWDVQLFSKLPNDEASTCEYCQLTVVFGRVLLGFSFWNPTKSHLTALYWKSRRLLTNQDICDRDKASSSVDLYKPIDITWIPLETTWAVQSKQSLWHILMVPRR